MLNPFLITPDDFSTSADTGVALDASPWEEAGPGARRGRASRVPHHFVLRTAEGRDERISFRGSFTVRDGQRITAVWARRASDESRGRLVALYNHDAGTEQILSSGLDAVRGTPPRVFYTVVVSVGVTLLALLPFGPGFWGTVGLCVLLMLALGALRRSQMERVDTHLIAEAREWARGRPRRPVPRGPPPRPVAAES